MDLTLLNKSITQIRDELLTMHNHIGIYAHSDLGRLVGLHVDDMDIYYKIKPLRLTQNSLRIVHFSYVGPFLDLKPIVPVSEYEHMDNIAEINGCTKEEMFLLDYSEMPPLW